MDRVRIMMPRGHLTNMLFNIMVAIAMTFTSFSENVQAGTWVTETIDVKMNGGWHTVSIPSLTWLDASLYEDTTNTLANNTSSSNNTLGNSTLNNNMSSTHQINAAIQDHSLPSFSGFEPKSLVVTAELDKTVLVSVVGRNLNSTGPWKCRYSKLTAVLASVVDDNHLICPVPATRASDVGKHTITMEHEDDTYADYKMDGDLWMFPAQKVKLLDSSIIGPYGSFAVSVIQGNITHNASVPITVELRKRGTTAGNVVRNFKLPINRWWKHNNDYSKVQFTLPKLVNLEAGLYRVLFTMNNQSFVEASSKLRIYAAPSAYHTWLKSYTFVNKRISLAVRFADHHNNTIEAADTMKFFRLTQGNRNRACRLTELPKNNGETLLSCDNVSSTTNAQLSIMGVPLQNGTLNLEISASAASDGGLFSGSNTMFGIIALCVLVVIAVLIIVRKRNRRLAQKSKSKLAKGVSSEAEAHIIHNPMFSKPTECRANENPVYDENPSQNVTSIVCTTEMEEEHPVYAIYDNTEAREKDEENANLCGGFTPPEDVDTTQNDIYAGFEKAVCIRAANLQNAEREPIYATDKEISVKDKANVWNFLQAGELSNGIVGKAWSDDDDDENDDDSNYLAVDPENMGSDDDDYDDDDDDDDIPENDGDNETLYENPMPVGNERDARENDGDNEHLYEDPFPVGHERDARENDGDNEYLYEDPFPVGNECDVSEFGGFRENESNGTSPTLESFGFD